MSKKKFSRDNRCRSGRNDDSRASSNIVVSAKTDGQRRLIMEIKGHDIVICTGPAGSGKTYLSVGLALQYLLASSSGIEKIIFMRPVKEACDEKIGSLPGDLSEKMTPWMAPIVDNMQEFIEQPMIRNLFWEKKVEIVPLAYARGRSLNKSFIMVDEAQNCSKKQMLMILTRIGRGSKMVINGDVSQSDDHSIVNGLSDAMDRLQGIEGIGFAELGHEDIVRNPLISHILERYEQPDPKSEGGHNGNGNGNGNRVQPITADSIFLRQVQTP